MRRQPWIYNAFVDGVFILAVPFLIVAITLLFSSSFSQPDSMTVVSWAILVMGVDVSHVYSTLYRTYLDAETTREHRTFLYLLPFAVLVVSMLLYSLGALIFWRVMAYLAVFHFARQQYGFMRVYARQESPRNWSRRLDALAVYTATFYPIADWHLAGQKNFNWFMKGDFLYFSHGGLRSFLFALYLGVILLYLGKEIYTAWHSGRINIPRNAILAGTFLSWYVGIVHFNSDLAFTAINVIAHGVPYMALVWIWGRKKYFSGAGAEKEYRVAEQRGAETQKSTPLPRVRLGAFIFRRRHVVFFLASLLLFAYLEEGLWNVWVWHDKEHAVFFGPFHAAFGDLDAASPWLRLIVPLLSVPQVTHYVIDGFIWKLRKDKYAWSDITLSRA